MKVRVITPVHNAHLNTSRQKQQQEHKKTNETEEVRESSFAKDFDRFLKQNAVYGAYPELPRYDYAAMFQRHIQNLKRLSKGPQSPIKNSMSKKISDLMFSDEETCKLSIGLPTEGFNHFSEARNFLQEFELYLDKDAPNFFTSDAIEYARQRLYNLVDEAMRNR